MKRIIYIVFLLATLTACTTQDKGATIIEETADTSATFVFDENGQLNLPEYPYKEVVAPDNSTLKISDAVEINDDNTAATWDVAFIQKSEYLENKPLQYVKVTVGERIGNLTVTECKCVYQVYIPNYISKSPVIDDTWIGFSGNVNMSGWLFVCVGAEYQEGYIREGSMYFYPDEKSAKSIPVIFSEFEKYSPILYNESVDVQAVARSQYAPPLYVGNIFDMPEYKDKVTEDNLVYEVEVVLSDIVLQSSLRNSDMMVSYANLVRATYTQSSIDEKIENDNSDKANLSDNSDENDMSISDDIPLPYGGKMGEDHVVNFNHQCLVKFDGIPGELQDLISQEQADEYYAQYSFDVPESSILKSQNLYTFKEYFDITDDVFTNVMKDLSARYILVGEPDMALTDEEINIICSGDIQKISETFVSPYAICVDDQIYTPNWLYYNSTDEYTNVGITIDDIVERAGLYDGLMLRGAAFEVFEEKLSNFTGESIIKLP